MKYTRKAHPREIPSCRALTCQLSCPSQSTGDWGLSPTLRESSGFSEVRDTEYPARELPQVAPVSQPGGESAQLANFRVRETTVYASGESPVPGDYAKTGQPRQFA